MDEKQLYASLAELKHPASVGYVDASDPAEISLDGWFSLPELELIVAYMKSHQSR